MSASQCDTCSNYCYDDKYEDYYCMANFDEDDMAKFQMDRHYVCPYYQFDNEYSIVRKQM